ncbi:DUF1254 domain-containing protein [Variovorax sp. dw_954]|uniref:DUF1254 domain-containing protein n=1 Tax=Variovorax sp. dw_954 TaxID=2720078 RepID=UPI001BD25EBF|nr:DUF1254 domain-containing protein [Variovorax sp. dw_954]
MDIGRKASFWKGSRARTGCLALGALLVSACSTPPPSTEAVSPAAVQTRVGKVELQSGYPSEASVRMLYDEMDFQRAVQAYIWATPIVAMDALRIANVRDWGVDYNGVGIVDQYTGSAVVALTGNSTTIYAAAFSDLSRDGPVVIESPPGAYGVIDDYWQRPVAEVGPFGPDKGKGGKFLVVPADYKGSAPRGYLVVRSKTNRFMYLVRGIVKDGNVKAAVDMLSTIRIYPQKQAASPPATQIFKAGAKGMDSIAPRGYAYWERLADIIDKEPVEERDRFFYAMLKPLGIEKGKPFAPDERQKKILTDAAPVGFLMAQTISMAPRLPTANAYPGTHWEWVLTLKPSQEAPNYSQLDERTDYTFEAITVAEGMVKEIVGAGSQYMSAAKDSTGAWLDGGKSYKLKVPANVPAKDFWSVTVYDNLSRSMVQNGTAKVALSSYDKLQRNADGSIDLYFGPAEPAGMASNWVKTVPGKGWFAYFRWYGPTQAFFDKSWRLPDIAPAS